MRFKIKKIAFVLFLMLFMNTSSVYAFFYQLDGEKIVKSMDLPNTQYFQTEDGQYIDVGIRYKQFSILFIPVWNYDEKWCGYIQSDNQYLDYEKKDLSEMADTAALRLPENISLPLWDSVGGKLLFLLVLVLYLGYEYRHKWLAFFNKK